jgi:hypothetical protein
MGLQNRIDKARQLYWLLPADHRHLDSLQRFAALPATADDMQWVHGPIPENEVGNAFRKGYADAMVMVHTLVRVSLDKIEGSDEQH